ncbi:unnamed protein product, partial [Dovyalis caffra]
MSCMKTAAASSRSGFEAQLEINTPKESSRVPSLQAQTDDSQRNLSHLLLLTSSPLLDLSNSVLDEALINYTNHLYRRP